MTEVKKLDLRSEDIADEKRADLLQLRRTQSRGDSVFHLSIRGPDGLLVKQRGRNHLILVDAKGGIGINGGYARVGVHGQRKIAVDEVDFALVDIIGHQRPKRIFVENLATGALEITEDFDDDRSGRDALRLDHRRRFRVRRAHS